MINGEGDKIYRQLHADDLDKKLVLSFHIAHRDFLRLGLLSHDTTVSRSIVEQDESLDNLSINIIHIQVKVKKLYI